MNLNRLFTCEPGSVVEAKCSFNLSEEKEILLSFGYSDHLRLWVNEEEVYQGDWQWHSPGETTDGRIRSNQVRIPIRWLSGLNKIRAEVMSKEGMFGKPVVMTWAIRRFIKKELYNKRL